MVGLGILLMLLLGSGEPYVLEFPDSVQEGDVFPVTIICIEPGCSGIELGRIPSSSGLTFRSSSSYTEITTTSSNHGRQLAQVLVLEIIFMAEEEGNQTIGPLNLTLRGIGTYSIDEIAISVSNSSSSRTTGSTDPEDEVWLTGILRDPGGRIYPGTRLFIDYYVYASIEIENVTYWWEAPELGVIRHVETIPDSNWESAPGKHDNSNRSLLAEVEMSPAAAGSLLAPAFTADITGGDYDRWGKVANWTIESTPIVLPVYPFPENPPEGWDCSLLDSVSLRIDELPAPPGQGGELSLRISCVGPGSHYMDTPPQLTIHGDAELIPADNGSAPGKKWWDFVLEPTETGYFILGPDSIVWLNRQTYMYSTTLIEPCSLYVSVIPRADREIELSSEKKKGSPLCWVTTGILGIITLTIMFGVAARRRDKRLASVTSARDLDELLSGLETELSRMLTGKKEYLGYEELNGFLNDCDTDSFLARRILRFWRDLEQSISDKEITGPALTKLKETADELLEKLRKDIELNNEKE